MSGYRHSGLSQDEYFGREAFDGFFPFAERAEGDPSWEDLTPAIQGRWIRAADVVRVGWR